MASCSNHKKSNKYSPQINLHPKHFVTIKGYIDPRLQHRIKINWITRFYTQNKSCEITINEFEGVHAPRMKSVTLKITPNRKGAFKYKLPTDKYLPGYCIWKTLTAYYQLNDKNKNLGTPRTGIDFGHNIMWTLTRYSAQAMKIKAHQHITGPSIITDSWLCKSNAVCKLSSSSAIKANSYIYNIKIFYKG